jgi:SAM-dependent methyltransferase
MPPAANEERERKLDYAMKEYDIRPAEIYAELLRLSAKDAVTIFDHVHSALRDCPACGGASSREAFVKAGFTFCECSSCKTLFANPLPAPEQFERFYRDGEAAKYWTEVFVPRVMESRRASIVRPRVANIRQLCSERGVTPCSVVDVGAGHGMFLEEWLLVDPSITPYAVEPNGDLADICRKLGFNVYEGVGERASQEWKAVVDLATSFEVVEHVPDLLSFVSSMYGLLKPGGLALITSLGCDGFDIRVLGANANCICPPSHINFCSRLGYKTLFERAGFTDVEVITPGQLDVDIVRNKVAQSDIQIGGFERLLLSASPETQADFQKFLQRNALSSHTWVVARKA